jgi:hypothetical protein
VKDALFKVGGTERCPALKVPRLCPFVLLDEVRLREGQAVGSGHCCE